MSTELSRIAEKAKTGPRLRFTSLAHLLTPKFLKETWKQMNRHGASGVDGETIRDYERDLDGRIGDLHERLKAGRYKALPVRRVNIPKGNGKTRLLGIPTVEDRLVQRAFARILEAIYEADFYDVSYGFRPGRNPHQALRRLRECIMAEKVGYVFEADIRGYFNHINHSWLIRMLRARIRDTRILRLIEKWLRAGAMENGVVRVTGEGTPQGQYHRSWRTPIFITCSTAGSNSAARGNSMVRHRLSVSRMTVRHEGKRADSPEAMLSRRWGRALRSRQTGGGSKPPQAAVGEKPWW